MNKFFIHCTKLFIIRSTESIIYIQSFLFPTKTNTPHPAYSTPSQN